MDNPCIIHAETDIGFVTKWHAMEEERFLTRQISRVFRRASFSFAQKSTKSFKTLETYTHTIQNRNRSKPIITNKKAQIRNQTLFQHEASSHKRLEGSPEIGTVFLSSELCVIRSGGWQRIRGKSSWRVRMMALGAAAAMPNILIPWNPKAQPKI